MNATKTQSSPVELGKKKQIKLKISTNPMNDRPEGERKLRTINANKLEQTRQPRVGARS